MLRVKASKKVFKVKLGWYELGAKWQSQIGLINREDNLEDTP